MTRLPVSVALAVAFVASMFAPLPLDLIDPGLGGALLCHLAHTSWTQLLCAGATTVLLSALCELRLGSRDVLMLLAGAAVFVSACVLRFESGRLAYYLGSSGLGHAVAAVWALRVVSCAPRTRALLAVLLAGKVGVELATGAVAFSAGLDGVTPVPIAHAAGLAVGAVFSLIDSARRDGVGDLAARPIAR